MKKILLTLFAALAFCGSISAQYDSHWDEFNYLAYQFNRPLVAFIQIDGEYVSEQDYEALEIAYFVGDECRGHDFLADYTEDGDPYPILEGAIYYTDPGEEVTFKLFNHATGVEYEGTPSIPIRTGEMYVELYFDYDEAVVLNFTSPEPPEPSGSYWPDFNEWDFKDQNPLIAGIMIDGEIINLDYENWDKLEVAAFVGDECRGNEMYLTDEGVYEFGHPYLMLELCPIYYNYDNNTGEEVSFKMYDHQNNVLYENCEVLYLDEPLTILTREDHLEGLDDPENPVFLNFITFDGLVLANDDSEKEEDKKNTALISAFVDEHEDDYVTNVKLKGRTLYRNQNWNTLCLPFDVEDFEGTPLEGATVMELDLDGKYNADGESDEAGTYQTGFDAGTGTLYLYFKNVEKIEAGKPYIVKWEDDEEELDDITDPVFYGVTIDATDPTAITFAEDKIQFIGTYSYTEYTDENKYVLLLGSNSNLFYPAGGETPTTIGAFRAYFQLLDGLKAGEPDQSGGIKNFVLNFGDGETAIQEIVNGKSSNGKSDDAWYDLSGRKLSGKPAQRGIYINNNKKSFIK